jgi:hypothetical protein
MDHSEINSTQYTGGQRGGTSLIWIRNRHCLHILVGTVFLLQDTIEILQVLSDTRWARSEFDLELIHLSAMLCRQKQLKGLGLAELTLTHHGFAVEYQYLSTCFTPDHIR